MCVCMCACTCMSVCAFGGGIRLPQTSCADYHGWFGALESNSLCSEFPGLLLSGSVTFDYGYRPRK